MDSSFCLSCINVEYPECAISRIYSLISLESLITREELKATEFPVCHKNAISFSDSKIQINGLCDNCGMCNIACIKNNARIFDESIENIIFSNLSRLNIYIKNILKNFTVATEVKAPGNFRNKRIDLVLMRDNKITIIKVLQNLNKYNFYVRSYNEIISQLSRSYSDKTFSLEVLVPQKILLKADTLKYRCISIEKFHSL